MIFTIDEADASGSPQYSALLGTLADSATHLTTPSLFSGQPHVCSVGQSGGHDADDFTIPLVLGIQVARCED